MATNNHTTTFWHFLENYSIEIPIIQRDYAQGRIGKENLRKNFLNDLKEALDKSKEMKLDFVYGSTENGKLYPLDGQQRLTTLWLLHWYIALRAGMLKEASDHLKNFSYETRVSSRNFCEEMCKPENFKNYNLKNTVVEFIINQTWFYSAWKQDPTIQSMLRMLGGSKQNNNIDDGIEKVFDCSSCIQSGNFIEGFKRSDYCQSFINYYNILTSEKCPIVFYYLPKDFGNSDDLYVKMNARGEQLTSFENFKADLIGYIKKQAENDNNWDALLDSNEGFPIKMDTNWTDIFWKFKSKGTSDCRMINRIDDIYFAFINRFFWNELFIAKDKDGKYILDIGKGDENSTKENDNVSYKYLNDSDNPNDYDTKIAYKGFDVYKYDNGVIPISFFKKMKNVLNNVSAYLFNDNSIPECPWDEKFHYIPKYDIDKDKNNVEITNNASDRILKVTTLNQVQRIVFFSICKYFAQDNHENNVRDDEESLKQWLRVVWNLVSGEDENGRPQIRSTQAVRTAIEFIEKLDDSHNVYNSLIKYNIGDLGNSDFDERCKEEIAKAKQILDESMNLRKYDGVCKRGDDTDYHTWEEIIKDAEKYAFFKGAIRFLFTDENGDVRDECWGKFDIKWVNAKQYFNDDELQEVRTLQYFISCCENIEQMKEIVYDNKATTWKSNLLNINLLKVTNDFLINTIPETLICGIVIAGKPKEIQEDLVLTNLLCNIKYNNQPVYGCKLREMHGQYALLPSNAKSDQKKYVVANKRNSILSSLISSTKIKSDQKISGCDFFYGWDINFEYNNQMFQWNTDEKVYLLEDGKRKQKNENESYRVGIANLVDSQVLITDLDNLIAQAYPEEPDKNCCDDCQNK